MCMQGGSGRGHDGGGGGGGGQGQRVASKHLLKMLEFTGAVATIMKMKGKLHRKAMMEEEEEEEVVLVVKGKSLALKQATVHGRV